MSRLRAAADAAAVVAASGAAIALLAAGYDRPGPAAAVLLAAAVAAVAVTAGAARVLPRLGPAFALLAGLPVAFAGLVALAARRPGPVREPVPAALDAVLHSGARILTTTSQAPLTVDLIAFPLLAVWLAGATGTALRRDGRGLPALLPGALLLAGAATLNPEAVGAGYRSAALLAVAGAVLLVLSPPERPAAAPAGITVRVLAGGFRPAPRRSASRRAAAGAVLACAVAVPSFGMVVAAPGVLDDWPVRAADPRTVVDSPEEPREVRNPLAYLSAWAAEPNRPLMTVRGPRTGLRWVALAEFTGPTWLPDSTYRPSGPALPPPGVRPPRAKRASVEVAVRDLPGDWVPVPGTPTRIEGLDFGYDAASGTALSSKGPVAGRTYRATGSVPDLSGGEASRATPALGPGFERYARLPQGAPARLIDIARKAAGDGTPHQRASRLAEYLRESYTIGPAARGGHGYAELNELLVEPGRKGGGGTSEQFASAFAVLARAAGLPSRIMVGFGPGTGGDGGRVVRTGDAVAWGEICYEGLGWVPYDPNPRVRSGAAERAGTGEGASGGPGPGGGARTPAPPRAVAAHSRPGTPVWPVAGLAVAAVLPLYLVAVPLLRWRRLRRMRRMRDCARKALTAWTEVLVAMRLAGVPAPPAATASEVTAHLERSIPGTDAARLQRTARIVNAAGFGGPVTSQDASLAVTEARSLIRELRRSRPWWRRASWWWDPRPLRWSAQSSRLTRRVQTGSAWATRSTSTTATTVRQ
ncbi:transglutaminase domain-containing protein [Actinomadura sp. LD22]|uniref:Transglutaminase domain-containing protein n=1 Tax=Actinomadura physcomitrii TaxID=2650748 RepID=A0A6I4MDG1_9ACTN|nr:transglutaminase domain-containing protein [Actinomadura physcomitrii]MWA02940.1 transglutaminase domain-containing protein [Actinomadura physcomitrii]